MTKLSTHKIEFNFPPFGRPKGSDKIVSKENGISFIINFSAENRGKRTRKYFNFA